MLLLSLLLLLLLNYILFRIILCVCLFARNIVLVTEDGHRQYQINNLTYCYQVKKIMNCRSIGIKYRCAANNRRHLKKLEAAVVIAMIKESMIGYKCLSEKKIQRKLTRQPGL